MEAVISKVIPILLLFMMGYIFKKTSYFNNETINGFKKAVINIGLPAVLFITFVNLEFKREYFALIIIIFVLCMILYFVGKILNNIPAIQNPILPFLMTGFCFGLLGIPLYSTVFGEANLAELSVIGVGHELFVWFVYVSLVKLTFKGEKFSLKTIKGFITSPLILAVVIGLFINLAGLSKFFYSQPILNGIYVTVEYLSKIATPLILIVVGYGLSFNKKYAKLTFIYVIIRTVGVLFVGYIIKILFIDNIIGTNQYFDYSYFTFLILPPPFSLPIFVSEYGTSEDAELANNVVVLHTCLCMVIYIGFVFYINLV